MISHYTINAYTQLPFSTSCEAPMLSPDVKSSASTEQTESTLWRKQSNIIREKGAKILYRLMKGHAIAGSKKKTTSTRQMLRSNTGGMWRGTPWDILTKSSSTTPHA